MTVAVSLFPLPWDKILFYISLPWIFLLLFGLGTTLWNKEYRMKLPVDKLVNHCVFSFVCFFISAFIGEYWTAGIWGLSVIIILIILGLVERAVEKERKRILSQFKSVFR